MSSWASCSDSPRFIDGTLVHWSHILGVRESARNAGVGRLLKEFQRAELARRGIARMYWTYDPLVAKNAHLNLNLLGARVVEYVRDMYGTTSSPLHNGLATDRLIVSCATTSNADRSARAFAPQPPHASGAHARAARDGDVTAIPDALAHAPVLLVEIPVDFQLARRALARACGALARRGSHALRVGAAPWLRGNRTTARPRDLARVLRIRAAPNGSAGMTAPVSSANPGTGAAAPITELRRTLGMLDLTFIAIGTVIGSGIFLVPGVVLRETGTQTGPALRRMDRRAACSPTSARSPTRRWAR